jgi:uncharacterized protein (UPF0335 family)
MERKYTSKKTYHKARYSNFDLWMEIEPKVCERVDKFWVYFFQKLSIDKNELLEIKSFEILKFDFKSSVIKQVYAMALMDGLNPDYNIDKELNNLIESCFSYPNLFTSMLFTDKEKLGQLFQNQIDRIEQKNKELISDSKTIQDDLDSHKKIMAVYNEILKKKKSAKKQKAKAELGFYEIAIPEFKQEVIRQAEKCRFKNGKINFTKLGKLFGKDHKTIKSWCCKYGIKFNVLE